MNVVMRSSSDPVALAGVAVKQQIHELNPDLPLYNISAMQERFDNSLARRRFTMLVLGTFSAISLGLAVIGIYGLIAYLVGQGSREVGIRGQLGATPSEHHDTDRARRDDACLLGSGNRHGWSAGCGPPDALVAVRCWSRRCGDLYCCSRSSDFDRFLRQLDSRAARFPHRSQHVVAMRIGGAADDPGSERGMGPRSFRMRSPKSCSVSDSAIMRSSREPCSRAHRALR